MSDFLGKGMKFPPQVDPVSGRFVVSEGAKSIKESIYIILMTQKTERWLRPSFGSSILNYAFTDTSSTMLNIMAREITEDIIANEPRVKDVSLRFDTDFKEGCVLVYMDYIIRESNTKDNMVFPFYLG